MTNDYIHRDDAIRLAEQGQVQGFPWQFQMLVRLPPANVAKIIRCENCQYRSYDEVFCCYWCEHEGMVREVKPDFYCGYGEE